MKVKIRKKPYGEIKIKVYDKDKNTKHQDKVLEQLKQITDSITDDMDFKLKVYIDID
jgi:hypothetical protein